MNINLPVHKNRESSLLQFQNYILLLNKYNAAYCCPASTKVANSSDSPARRIEMHRHWKKNNSDETNSSKDETLNPAIKWTASAINLHKVILAYYFITTVKNVHYYLKLCTA